MHWLTVQSKNFFLKKNLRKRKIIINVCECILLTFKCHNFMIIGVCLRFVLIENEKLYFKPHNLWIDLN